MVLASVLLASLSNAYGQLAFFRATHDKELYAKDPSRYDRVTLPRDRLTDELYVERVPALTIQLQEIQSVVIEKKTIETDLHKAYEKAFEETFGLEPTKDGKEQKAESSQYYYDVAISFRQGAAKVFRDFAGKNAGHLFDMRINGQRLVAATLLASFEGNVISTIVTDNDSEHLRTVLSPLKGKVTWK
jgi:preprotein translocase subunit SecD